MFFSVGRETRDLFLAIFRRNGHQNRLVESAADDFDLARRRQSAELVEIFRMRTLDPLEQRAGVVQAEADAGMARKHFNEGKVGILVGAFEHVVEISDRLMGVDEEDELEFRQRQTSMVEHRITRFRQSTGWEFEFNPSALPR